MWRLSVWQAQLEKAGVVAQQLSCDVCINVAEDMWPRGEKQIGGVQGAHSNPLGLFLRTFLRTSKPFVWRILSACLPA